MAWSSKVSIIRDEAPDPILINFAENKGNRNNKPLFRGFNNQPTLIRRYLSLANDRTIDSRERILRTPTPKHEFVPNLARAQTAPVGSSRMPTFQSSRPTTSHTTCDASMYEAIDLQYTAKREIYPKLAHNRARTTPSVVIGQQSSAPRGRATRFEVSFKKVRLGSRQSRKPNMVTMIPNYYTAPLGQTYEIRV